MAASTIYVRVSNGIEYTECQLFLLLQASCGCLQSYLYENEDTQETKTGREWLAIFLATPPDCTSSGGSGNTTTIVATADTDTTISDAAITGTVVGVMGNAGQSWVSGFTSAVGVVTITDGSNVNIGEDYLLFMQ